MNSKPRWILPGLVALLVAAAPALAQGAPPPPAGGLGMHVGPPDPVIGMAGRALGELDLSPEQRAQIHDLVHSYLESGLGQPLQSLKEGRHALELLVWDSEAIEQELLDAAAVVANAAESVELARHRLAVDILGVLTDEQRETFLQALATQPSGPDGTDGRGGPGGPDGRRGPGPRSR